MYAHCSHRRQESGAYSLNTAFAVNALVSMIMKALNVYCVIHFRKALSQTTNLEKITSTHMTKGLTYFTNKECI